MVHLIQLLLPLRDNDGVPYDAAIYQAVDAQLADRFGGTTAFSRAPAKGTWVHAEGKEFDDVIVMEVMVQTLDRAWWSAFRQDLEYHLRQMEIVIRAYPIERL